VESDVAAEVEGLAWEMEQTRGARDAATALPLPERKALLLTLHQLAAG
jgi:hypothetical protein